MLDVHRLKIFRSVVASGSVAAAATSLGYSPSAVSQHLTALQRETGLTLLERVGRGLRPTPAGLAVAAEADGVLRRLGQAESVVAELRDGRSGRLSIAYFASVGTAWLPDVARRLTTELPGVALDLQLREALAEDPGARPDIQLLVSGTQAPSTGAGFESHHLVDDPYLAVLPRTHPLAGRDTIELAELALDRWVEGDVPTGWCRRNLVETCAAAGFVPPFHVQANDAPTAVAFVGAGMGITVLPALAARHLPADVRSVPIVRPRPERSIYAVVRTAVASTPPARLVLAELASLAASTARLTVVQ